MKFNIGDYVFHQSDNTYGQIITYLASQDIVKYIIDCGPSMGQYEVFEFQIGSVKNPHVIINGWTPTDLKQEKN